MEDIVNIIISRFSSDVQGTKGNLSLYVNGTKEFECKTMELPWFNNTQSISCIESGQYMCEHWHSAKYSHVIHVKDVLNRSYVLTHSGNYAGSKQHGYKTHSAGCILVGKYHGTYKGQKGVFSSRPTLTTLMDTIGDIQKIQMNIIGIPFKYSK